MSRAPRHARPPLAVSHSSSAGDALSRKRRSTRNAPLPARFDAPIIPRMTDSASPDALTNADALPADAGLFCLGCGYDLRGLSGDTARCPECGLAIDRTVGGASRIPWAHRARI